MKAVLVTGGFDPYIVVISITSIMQRNWEINSSFGLNSDDWLSRKKGQPFYELRKQSKYHS